MDWYVIQAYSGYEQKVKMALEEKIELNNLSEKFGEILIPTEQIVELKGGAKKTTERKFCPGYILIQMLLEDDSWQLVQSTPKFDMPKLMLRWCKEKLAESRFPHRTGKKHVDLRAGMMNFSILSPTTIHLPQSTA